MGVIINDSDAIPKRVIKRIVNEDKEATLNTIEISVRVVRRISPE